MIDKVLRTPIVRVIPVDVFRCEVHIIFAESIDDAESLLAESYGIELEDDDFLAITFDLESIEQTEASQCYLVLYIRPYLLPGIVAHESFHVSKKITDRYGVNDEEASAYIIDYIVEETHKHIEQINSKKK